LGTALGLASSFFWVQSSAAPLNAVSFSYFSSGVWQALLTTIAGLFVGISSALVYNVCVIWANRTVSKLEREATEFANLLSYLSETTLNQDASRGLSEEP
jgi:biopolymer transport protein ExbB